MAWAPDYTTTDLLKSYLHIQHDDNDLWLASWITAVSRNVDDYCSRQFGQVAIVEERTYTPVWDRYEQKTYVEIDDLQNTTDFALVDYYGTAITDYVFEPKNALVKGGVYTRLYIEAQYSRDLTATGLWGWNAVPASIPTALYLQAARLAARRTSPFGIAGSPNDGNEIRLLAQLDPDFKTTLKPFIRKWYVR